MNAHATDAETAAPTRWTIRFGLLTDPGMARERNEDACAVFVPYSGESPAAKADALFVVADGMGGHEAGDVASAFVAREVRSWFTSGPPSDGQDDGSFSTELRHVLMQVNAALLAFGRERGLARGSGSTATIACVRGSVLHVVHVGDSRLYRLRDGAIEQLTEDHSWVAEQLRAGLLTEEETRDHPRRHMLTECLGVGSQVNVYTRVDSVAPGDRYLVCSDGLHGTMSDEEMRDLLARGSDPQGTARDLVALANDRDGPDNITAVVVHLDAPFVGTPTVPGLEADGADPLGDTGSDPIEVRPVSSWRQAMPSILVGAGVLVLCIAALAGAFGSGSGSRDDGGGERSEAEAIPDAVEPEGEERPTSQVAPVPLDEPGLPDPASTSIPVGGSGSVFPDLPSGSDEDPQPGTGGPPAGPTPGGMPR